MNTIQKFFGRLTKTKLEPALIGLALTVILGVELVVNSVSMAVMAPGELEKIGFIAMALVIVALGIPSYLLDHKGLWLCFMVMAVFLETSFIVESLRVQSTKSHPEQDYEVKRLDNLITEASTKETELQAEYNKAISGENMTRLKDTLDKKIAERQGYESTRATRIKEVVSNPIITGAGVFVAIPRGSGLFTEEQTRSMSGPIQILFFGLLFGASQRALVVFAGRGKKLADKKPMEVEPEPALAPIPNSEPAHPPRRFGRTDESKWISGTWTYVKHGRSPINAMVKKESFLKSYPSFPADKWDELFGRACRAGLIVKDIIQEVDQERALARLLDTN